MRYRSPEVLCCAVGTLSIIVAVAFVICTEDGTETDDDYLKVDKNRSLFVQIAVLADLSVVGVVALLSAIFLGRQICTRSCWETVLKKFPICLQDRLLSPESIDDIESLYVMESTLGARQPPSFCALCFYPACAISGYETGDPLDGIWAGNAWEVLRLNAISCCILGSLRALFSWKASPENIQGDGTQRTVNKPCRTGCLVGQSCTIAFWESGDLCTGLCRGNAVNTGILCWKPQGKYFRRTLEMHGGKESLEAPRQQMLGRGTGSARELEIPLVNQETNDDCAKQGSYHVLVHKRIVLLKGAAPRRRSLGVKNSVEECLVALQECQAVCAACWRPEGNRMLTAIDLREQILAGPVQYIHMPGSISFQKCWISLPNMHVDLGQHSEPPFSEDAPKGNYKGGLGDAWSAAECVSVLQGQENVNYAVWRKDKDNTLHVFDMSERMLSGPLKFFNLPGTMSFQASSIEFV